MSPHGSEHRGKDHAARLEEFRSGGRQSATRFGEALFDFSKGAGRLQGFGEGDRALAQPDLGSLRERFRRFERRGVGTDLLTRSGEFDLRGLERCFRLHPCVVERSLSGDSPLIGCGTFIADANPVEKRERELESRIDPVAPVVERRAAHLDLKLGTSQESSDSDVCGGAAHLRSTFENLRSGNGKAFGGESLGKIGEVLRETEIAVHADRSGEARSGGLRLRLPSEESAIRAVRFDSRPLDLDSRNGSLFGATSGRVEKSSMDRGLGTGDSEERLEGDRVRIAQKHLGLNDRANPPEIGFGKRDTGVAHRTSGAHAPEHVEGDDKSEILRSSGRIAAPRCAEEERRRRTLAGSGSGVVSRFGPPFCGLENRPVGPSGGERGV